jgi:hypothetical protein
VPSTREPGVRGPLPLPLIAAIAVVAAVVLVWRLHAASRPAPARGAALPTTPARVAPAPRALGGAAVASAPDPAEVSPPPAPTGAPPATAPPPAPADDRVAPGAPPTSAEPPRTARPMAEVGDDATALAREAARGCLGDDDLAAASGQSLTVRYTLTTGDDSARLEHVVAVTSDLARPGLADCMIAAIGAVTWPVDDALPGQRVIQDSIRLSDLAGDAR